MGHGLRERAGHGIGKQLIEDTSRIEPARLEDVPETIADVVADLSASSAILGCALHPTTAANLAIARDANCAFGMLDQVCIRVLLVAKNRCILFSPQN